ncbi:MAG: type II toxin-antitoxin system VapC family toxin [Cyclobacteriaceae bacterium]|nr:MAG: type II toxin-antitoxin system VapC family toxin [Cyclobacteriaceae bacterium]
MLDTHILLWWYLDPLKLKEEASLIIKNGTNEIYVSDAIIWEIVIKSKADKLKIPNGFIEEVEKDFEFLPINIKHILKTRELDLIHRDPFDRLLVAQASIENMTILTRDREILQYKVKTIEG